MQCLVNGSIGRVSVRQGMLWVVGLPVKRLTFTSIYKRADFTLDWWLRFP